MFLGKNGKETSVTAKKMKLLNYLKNLLIEKSSMVNKRLIKNNTAKNETTNFIN